MAASAGTREKLVFVPNVQQSVALKWPDGKIVSGQYGDQMYYTLSDGRSMYLNLDVAAKINMLEIRPNEQFFICKRWNGQRGQPVRWDVWRGGERYVDELPDPEPPSEVTRQLDESIRQVQARKGISPVPPKAGADSPSSPPRLVPSAPCATPQQPNGTASKTRLEDALKTVVAACHSAQLYAKELGFQMPPWSSEDLRTMANTLMIEGRK
jgi:hypothetical protein